MSGEKIIRIILAAIAFVILVTPSWRFTNGDLLQYCKPFANNAFKFDGLNTDESFKANLCYSYIMGQVDAGNFLCDSINIMIKEDISKNPREAGAIAMMFGNSAKRSQLNAVIQTFINYAEANPKDWEYRVNAMAWLTKDYPCDLDK